MKQAKQLLAAVLALGLPALSARAELVTQGVGILDTKLNVIWTKDANLLATLEGSTPASYSALVTAIIAANNGTIEDVKNFYDGDSKKYVLSASDFGTGGTADYWGAIAFVHYLNKIHYGGSSGWALPSITEDAALGYNQTGNAFGELYYTELGAAAGSTIPNGPFINIQTGTGLAGYWFAESYDLNANFAWFFSTTWGYQFFTHKIYQNYVWPVRPGPSLYTAR